MNVNTIIPEKKVCNLFLQIIFALDYLHAEIKVVHNVVKPENIMLDEYFNVKLIDFGLSGSNNTINLNKCETVKYMALEVIKCANITEKSDIRSAGITLFLMLFQYFPFESSSCNELFQKIVCTDQIYPNHTNFQIIDLLNHLLDKNCEKRWGIDEILNYKHLRRNQIF